MLFTRSIRRKMAVGFVLVAFMLAASSIAGLVSLHWYDSAVRDLDFSVNHMPRRADLEAAIGGLIEPLQYDVRLVPPADQQREFARRLDETRSQIRQFRRRLDALPPSDGVQAQRRYIWTHLDALDGRLMMIARDQALLADPARREVVAWTLLSQVGQMLTQVRNIHDPQQGLSRTIRTAIDGYPTRVRWVAGSGIVVFLVFGALCYYAWYSIYTPLRTLHKGARRVAQGDFNYRVKLKTLTTDDEIQELAEAFNCMTDRFQEITRDLDARVSDGCKQLVRSERLAGIGFLSAGVAHEINNPLAAIAMAAEGLEMRGDELFGSLDEADRSLVRQYLGMIQREAFRCQAITRRLLDFARGEEGVRASYDLSQTIGEVLEMVSHMGKYRDRTIDFQAAGPVRLEGNAPEVKQVVLNLVANSLEAMEDGGTLRLGVEEQTDAVVLTFTDDGCGMDQETIDHLFEPFFTRRKHGKGTGLGLSITHRIVADHGGTIEATSDGPGTGSTFRVRLPRRSVAVQAA